MIGQATGLIFGREIGFDIEPATYTAYVVQASSNTESDLYTMDLATGVMRRIGAIGVIEDASAGLALAAPGRVTFEVDQVTLAENAGAAQLRITRVGGSDGPITIDYATVPSTSAEPGGDYVHTSGTLIFLGGETTKTISIPIVNDAIAEAGDETLTVRLGAPTLGTSVAGTGVATIRITDDDAASPSAPAIAITAPTSEPTMIVSSSFVDLAGTASDDTGIVSVTWSDSTGQSGTAQGTTAWQIPAIPLREQTTTITVKARDDSGAEAVDTLIVTRGAFASLLAEGATGSFFDLDILLANPEAAPRRRATHVPQGGRQHAWSTRGRCRPLSRTTVRVDEIPGMEATAASTEVTSSAARSSSSGRCGGTTRRAMARTRRRPSRRRAEVVFRRRLAGLLLHIPAARQSAATRRTARRSSICAKARRRSRARIRSAPRSRFTVDAGADAGAGRIDRSGWS